MNPRRTTRTALVALSMLPVVLLAGACGSDDETGSAGTADEQPVGDADSELVGVVRDDPLDVSAVSLPEEPPGEAPTPFTTAAAPGQLLLVYFGYTSCPDVCPTTLSDVKAVLADLGDDADRVDLAMVTVDPERDTPEVLDGYLDHFLDRYHVLRTTDTAQLEAAEAAFGASSSVTTDDEGRVEVSHTGTLYAVDDTGTVLVEWPFGTPRDAVANDLAILLARQDTPSGA